MKKIELNILIFIIIEALFLIYGIHINILNVILGTILGLLLIIGIPMVKKNSIIKYILLIITIFLLINALINTTLFITSNLLKNYSNIIILLSIIFISYLLIKDNYHNYIKAVEIIFYLLIIIKVISFLLIIPNINLDYFNNDLLNELKINITTLYIGLIIYYIHQTIYYLNDYLVNLKIYIISVINIIIMKFISIVIIGRTLFYTYKYPYMNILRQIKYLDFFERMEGVLSFEYLFSFIVLTAYFMLFIKSFIRKKKN